MHEQGGWTFQYDVELERPVELIPNQTYSMEIFVDESVMEVYVNDEVAMSVRAYDLHDRKFGFAVSDGAVKFENVKLTTFTLKKLKKNKKYYIKVRAVRKTGKTKVYGLWSKPKRI